MSDFTSLDALRALLLFHPTFYAHQIVLLMHNMESPLLTKNVNLHYFNLYYHASNFLFISRHLVLSCARQYNPKV